MGWGSEQRNYGLNRIERISVLVSFYLILCNSGLNLHAAVEGCQPGQLSLHFLHFKAVNNLVVFSFKASDHNNTLNITVNERG